MNSEKITKALVTENGTVLVEQPDVTRGHPLKGPLSRKKLLPFNENRFFLAEADMCRRLLFTCAGNRSRAGSIPPGMMLAWRHGV